MMSETKAYPSIFAAVTAARGSRPAAVEVSQRESMHSGEWTFDSREWDWDDSDAPLDMFDQKDVPQTLPVGTVVDCYIWRRYGSVGPCQEIFQEGNMFVTRVEAGWVVTE